MQFNKKLISTRTLGLTAIIASSLLTGCASIVSGTNQVVSVESRNKSEVVAGATCQLTNSKGTYYVTTPGTVTVSRSMDDMNVKCEKASYPPGIATVKSTTKAMAFGNVIFGGVIGAGVDIASGAAFDYPTLISVMLGEPASVAELKAAVAADTSTPAAPTIAKVESQ